MPTTGKLTPLCKFFTPNSKFDPKPKTPQNCNQITTTMLSSRFPHLISHAVETDREKRKQRKKERRHTDSAKWNWLGRKRIDTALPPRRQTRTLLKDDVRERSWTKLRISWASGIGVPVGCRIDGVRVTRCTMAARGTDGLILMQETPADGDGFHYFLLLESIFMATYRPTHLQTYLPVYQVPEDSWVGRYLVTRRREGGDGATSLIRVSFHVGRSPTRF